MGNEYKDNIPIDEITKSIRAIKYGQVQITIHDSEVVQIDKIEKIRIDKPGQNRKSDTDSYEINKNK
jgi:hypothetical protein